MCQSIGVATRVSENEVIRNRVEYRLTLRDDDEFGRCVAALDLASGSDVVVDVGVFVDVADDAGLWLRLEAAIDEPLQIGVPEIVIEHSDWNTQVLMLHHLISTAFPKAGEEAEFEPALLPGEFVAVCIGTAPDLGREPPIVAGCG